MTVGYPAPLQAAPPPAVEFKEKSPVERDVKGSAVRVTSEASFTGAGEPPISPLVFAVLPLPYALLRKEGPQKKVEDPIEYRTPYPPLESMIQFQSNKLCPPPFPAIRSPSPVLLIKAQFTITTGIYGEAVPLPETPAVPLLLFMTELRIVRLTGAH